MACKRFAVGDSGRFRYLREQWESHSLRLTTHQCGSDEYEEPSERRNTP
jgi:hypothetical protein